MLKINSKLDNPASHLNNNVSLKSAAQSSEWNSRRVNFVGTLPRNLFYVAFALLIISVVAAIVGGLYHHHSLLEIAFITGASALGGIYISAALESLIND